MTSTQTTDSGTPSVNRRTIVKGVAWSAPVLTAAVATPAMAASPNPTVDVVVSSRRCNLAELGDPPYFVISAVNGPIPAGSVFTMSSGTGLGVQLDLGGNGLGTDFGILQRGDDVILTLKDTIPAGGSLNVNFLKKGTLDVGINRNATLSLTTLAEGGTDTNPNNNSHRMSWSGVGLFGTALYTCSHN